MEAVKAFNDELFSVQETKGPISRAKMAKITAIAIKTVKFYKHVVHGVEKFIQKSDVEHKIPGLYVMDSIIRQSIHKFGVERDVFASRFANNIFGTFQHLLQCKEDEKVKIVRVLQLWQKNSVFSNDLIQKLLDVIEKSSEGTTHSDETSNVDMSLASNDSEALQGTGSQQLDSSQILNNVCQMLQSDKATQINQLLQQVANNHPQLLPQLSQIIQLSQNQNSSDGDRPDNSDKVQPSEQSSSKPNEMPGVSSFSSGDFEGSSRVANWQLDDAKSGFSDSSRGRGWTSEHSGIEQGNAESGSNAFGNYHLFQSGRLQQSQHRATNDDSFVEREEGETWDDEEMSHFQQHGAHEMDYNYNNNKHQWSDHHNDDRHFPRKRRRSGDRGSNERSQRSRSREKRRRSRSREKSYRSDSRERHEGRQKRETERNRGLPTSKPEHALICSTTLWIGHLNKHTTEQELKMELSNYGNVTSLNLIPPRGCAFVTFSARTEAQKALDRVKGKKFNNNVLKVAWAIGSGMKESELKEFWDLEQGLSFIPWSRLDADADLDALAEGGILDEESLPQDLLNALREKRDSDLAEDDLIEPDETINNNNNSTDKLNNCQTRPMPNVAPPCFPHLPLPLPGMPPLLPPPPGLMVGIPPPMIPPMAMMSPSQGNRSEGTTSPSVGTPGKPRPEVHVPPPSFPPPPLPGWNGPGMRPLPPPMPFPPPPVNMRPMVPPQTLPPKFEPEANANESLELEDEPDFNSHQIPKSFRGPLRPPPLRSPGPWAFNSRGGPRPPPPHRHHPRDEEFYRDGPHDGGRPFPPNRFSPRFRPDHYQQHHQSRGRGNWDRGGFRKNFRNWGENDAGEERGDKFCPEGERYFDQQRADDWDREHRDFPRHQDMRWNNRRNNRWGEDLGRGFGRGGPRWHRGEREDPRWSRGNRGNHGQPRDEGRRHHRQHHEVDDFKPDEDAYPETMGRSMDASISENWRETDNCNESQKDESTSIDCAKEQQAPLSDAQDKKRVKKSRWDAGDDRPEMAADAADGRCDI